MAKFKNMDTDQPKVNRRSVMGRLLTTAGGIALVGCRDMRPSGAPSVVSKPGHASQPNIPSFPAPTDTKAIELPDGKRSQDFDIHSPSPLAAETKRARMPQGPVTATEHFFVRNNLKRPSERILEDRDSWTLTVEGLVESRTISLGELKTLGFTSSVSVLQCSGNGRAFFDHGASGSQWATGAAGCAIWSGVSIASLFEHLGGPHSAARFLTATGGDPLPEGVPKDSVVVERSIPLEKGLRDCLLAWEMNGEPLSIAHGGPLRLVVPGYFGCNQIKYVKTLAATQDESSAKIQQTGYRFRPIGQRGDPSQPSMWRMPVKSWLNGPGADNLPIQTGSTVFYGVAFSGERGVTQVEISRNGGHSWEKASLIGPDLGPNAWRPFTFRTALTPGKHTLYSRATDSLGETQPRNRVENERGYGHNGWYDHGLTITVSENAAEQRRRNTEAKDAKAQATQAEIAAAEKTTDRGRALFNQGTSPACGACHTLEDAGSSGMVGPNLDTLQADEKRIRNALKNGVGAMPAYGAQLSEDQISDLTKYLLGATRK